jgi:uncharacterized lipoprotein
MKMRWAILVVLLCAACSSLAQDEKKSTGTEMKDTAKTATKDT